MRVMCSCVSCHQWGRPRPGAFNKPAALKSLWSRLPDLNRRPTDYESVALPTELSRLVRDADPKASRLALTGIANSMARRIASGAFERYVRKITYRRLTRTEYTRANIIGQIEFFHWVKSDISAPKRAA